ncbi:DNA topoisomerase IV alpha subunit [Obba rivulosa]|uniref:DNA topoisomerase (ATP-hydrolyzing) n=1 Tax=Obba rivulosa TaxID=1052685 RepID=A0A8E2B5J7_9APHY|nr:DNA topoisomerase IV alpha subunit [Obba rivulosa]
MHATDTDLNTRDGPIARLEGIILSLLTQMSVSVPTDEERQATSKKFNAKKLVLELIDRKRSSNESSDPFQTSRLAAQLLKVVNLLHEALVDDIPTTKRDMYYKDVQLFKSQSVVDRLVDDLAATFELGRADLHVRASSKGLIAGVGLTIHLTQGDVIHVNTTEASLIPASEEISQFEVDSQLSWVLVVEKEAVFQTLCRLNIAAHPYMPGPGLLITGKGYPDVATRELVKTLSDNLPPSIPILCLVDGDAFGIDILSVYKRGSSSMSHEREKLVARRVKWLGLWASELAGLGVDKDALIPITKHDEGKKALSMLRRPDLPRKWRKELQYMLHSRRKAEIEILSTLKPSNIQRVSGNSDINDLAIGNAAQPPLLRYLISKITAMVQDGLQKYM